MIEKTIRNLLLAAPPIDNPIVRSMRDELPANATAPYLECQVVLNGGYSIAGVLTTFGDDTLRLAAIGKTPDGKIMVADHFFEYDDVQAIVIGREMPKSLVQPVGRQNGSSIILGH